MKNLILLFAIIFSALTLSIAQSDGSNSPEINPNAPEITFENTTHDFGELTEGPKATYKFNFVNTGNEPLIITKCKATCGCTVAKCPEQPIMPGESGFIIAEFDTKGKISNFSKSVTVTSNAKNPRKVIHIKGKVVKQKSTPEKNQLNLGESGSR